MYVCMYRWMYTYIYIYIYIHSKLYGCNAVPGLGMKNERGDGRWMA